MAGIFFTFFFTLPIAPKMHPILIHIPIFGGVTIHTYGIFAACGFFLGMVWVYFETRRLKQDPQKNMDLLFYVLLSAIVGSRLLHVIITEWDDFLANPLIFFHIWKGGLVFYGGLMASLSVSAIYIYKKKMPFFLTFDIFAPGIALGHAMGRIGCLMAGCCHGRSADSHAWYSIIFSETKDCFAPTNIALYPTQLMESLAEFSVFFILFIMRKKKKFDGQLIATYLILYAIVRYWIELYRGDIIRGFIIDPWLSTSQFISIIMISVGLFVYYKRLPRMRRS